MGGDTFTVSIQGPQAILWQGLVRSLSSENSEGPFSILPDHARFMTVIEGASLTLELPDSSEVVYTYPKAVLAYADNQARIYVQPTQSISD